MDGFIEHEDDGYIDGYSAGVSASAFSAVATFENPYARSVGGWDYGFLFRRPAADTFHVVVVTDDSRWFHYLREGSVNNGRLVDSGRTAVLRRNEGESNELRVVADDDRGWFFVNGERVATLDLNGGPAVGDVTAFSGYFNDNVVAGYSTPFRGFTVTEPRSIGGESGELRHDNDELIEQAYVSAAVSDFIATATFRNPYSSRTAPWDYGISFRDADTPDMFHAVTVQSTGHWGYFVRDGSNTPAHQESGVASLNLGQGAENQLYILAVGGTALLYINDSFVTELDISRGSGSGHVWVGTGFYAGNEITGYSTGYDSQVWSLDGT